MIRPPYRIASGTPISVTGGEYSINGGAYTSAAGTVNNGDYVTVQATASANYCDTTSAVISIGGVKSQFSVTTPASGLTSLSLGISPARISLGQQATLTWSTANATNCAADGGKIGGGGALDLASLAGLVMLAGLARRPKRSVALSDDLSKKRPGAAGRLPGSA